MHYTNIKMKSDYDKIISAIKDGNYDIISFDIFDTLLVRPFIKPTDLFREIAEKLNRTNYYSERIMAEKKAREGLKDEYEEVTIDEIYDMYAQINKLDISEVEKYKEIEMQSEIQCLRVRKSVKELYDIARVEKKRIIVVSDMYLPESFLEEVLRKNGYNSHENLYISSRHKLTKRTGTLYKKISDCYAIKGIEKNRILHIGDNFGSDYKMANKCGWNAIYYPKCLDAFKNRIGEHKIAKYVVPKNIKKINELFDNPFIEYPDSIINEWF